MNLKQGCGTPGCTDPNCTYADEPAPAWTTPDNRMVQCVLTGYTTCPAKVPEACVCYQMQQTPTPKHRNLYEELYAQKYGKDEQ